MAHGAIKANARYLNRQSPHFGGSNYYRDRDYYRGGKSSFSFFHKLALGMSLSVAVALAGFGIGLTPHVRKYFHGESASKQQPKTFKPFFEALLAKPNRLVFNNLVAERNGNYKLTQDTPYLEEWGAIAVRLLEAFRDRPEIFQALINPEGGLEFSIHQGSDICFNKVQCTHSITQASSENKHMTIRFVPTVFNQESGAPDFYHELGHLLDHLSFETNGYNTTASIVESDGLISGWSPEQVELFKQAREIEKRKLVGSLSGETILTPNALRNDQEFLAGVTDAYFTQPDKLHSSNPALFHLMNAFFHPQLYPTDFPNPNDPKTSDCIKFLDNHTFKEDPRAVTPGNIYLSPHVTFSLFSVDSDNNYQQDYRSPLSPYEAEITQSMVQMLKERPDLFYTLTHLPGGLHIKVYDGQDICQGGKDCNGGDMVSDSAAGSITIRESTRSINASKPCSDLCKEDGYSITHHEIGHAIDALYPTPQSNPIEFKIIGIDGLLPGWTQKQQNLFIEQRELEIKKIKKELNEPTAMRDYALKNNHEFLATLVETYFKIPNALYHTNRILYQLMDEFFHPQKYPLGFPEGEHVQTGLAPLSNNWIR